MKLKHWQALAGMLFPALVTMGVAQLFGMLEKHPVPMWGSFLAATLGIVLWIAIKGELHDADG